MVALALTLVLNLPVLRWLWERAHGFNDGRNCRFQPGAGRMMAG